MTSEPDVPPSAETLLAECSETLHMVNLNIPGWEEAVERTQADLRAHFKFVPPLPQRSKEFWLKKADAEEGYTVAAGSPLPQTQEAERPTTEEILAPFDDPANDGLLLSEKIALCLKVGESACVHGITPDWKCGECGIGLGVPEPPSVPSEEPPPEKCILVVEAFPRPPPPDEPLDVETEKRIADLCDEAVIGARELRQFARDVRRPVETYPTAWAYEQACKALSKAKAELSEARQALEAAHRVRRAAMESMERARPLCPDHRDKQRGEECLACKVEAAGRDQHTPAGLCRITELRERAEAAEAQVADLEQRAAGLAEALKNAVTMHDADAQGTCPGCWFARDWSVAALDGWAKRGTP